MRTYGISRFVVSTLGTMQTQWPWRSNTCITPPGSSEFEMWGQLRGCNWWSAPNLSQIWDVAVKESDWKMWKWACFWTRKSLNHQKLESFWSPQMTIKCGKYCLCQIVAKRFVFHLCDVQGLYNSWEILPHFCLAIMCPCSDESWSSAPCQAMRETQASWQSFTKRNTPRSLWPVKCGKHFKIEV